ncbi:hypothetical protein BHQ17_14675 [Mycolicibacterium holsaticum]|uniref:AMP-dependent synthetase/ligase domain-containing protein n=1 Tax=Mycolicibacterium holsaticum TaxID=152142 RepID=A0A1E3RT52_9MYCO|nr:hypothetical protein [Mycolicibacterium holsaticum DSM 44478 = JCM 12374]ODQ93083.1 hypothetical protein BHQ17_14675 [Mycolicibacterium holsaticum]
MGLTVSTDLLVEDLVARQARHRPDHIAIQHGDGALTYRDSDRLADRLAAGFAHFAQLRLWR